jgi:hypothetical protein
MDELVQLIKAFIHIVFGILLIAKIIMNVKCGICPVSNGGGSQGVSLMPGVELLLAVIVAASIPLERIPFYSFKNVAVGLFLLSVFSYMPLYLKNKFAAKK